MMHLDALEGGNLNSHVASGVGQKKPKHSQPARRGTHGETPGAWRKLAKEAASHSAYQPPAERVSAVKAAFTLADIAARQPKTGCLILLLYDSFSQPATPGIRSGPTRARQLLYRAEPYQIDLQIEALPESNRLVVSGQLLDVSLPEMVGRDVQVTLSNRHESVVRTMTNQFGEFRAELDNSGDLELSLLGRTGKPIVILLRGALDPPFVPEE